MVALLVEVWPYRAHLLAARLSGSPRALLCVPKETLNPPHLPLFLSTLPHPHKHTGAVVLGAHRSAALHYRVCLAGGQSGREARPAAVPLQEQSTAAAVNNGTTGEGETHGRPSQQRGDVHHPALPSPRVKLDTAKQQGPYRVRLLVAGGVANAAAVVLQLERHLTEQAESVQAVHQQQRLLRQQELQAGDGLPLQQQQAKANDAAHSWRQHPTPPTLRTHASRPMSWRVLVHRHVEGGGPAHLGWAAVDVVPERAGPAWALRHVAGRFGLQLGLLASCMEAASGDHELVSELCGLGSVRVGPPTRSAFSATAASAGGAAESSLATAAYGPSAIPEGLSGRGNSVNSGSGVYRRVAAAPTVMPTLTGPRSILDGLVSLSLV